MSGKLQRYAILRSVVEGSVISARLTIHAQDLVAVRPLDEPAMGWVIREVERALDAQNSPAVLADLMMYSDGDLLHGMMTHMLVNYVT